MVLLKKILAVNLSIFLLAALVVLAVGPGQEAAASPFGLYEMTYPVSMWEFEADVTGCADWRDGNDYLTWQEATKLTPLGPSCVWHATSLASVSLAWFGWVQMAAQSLGDGRYTGVNKILLSANTSGIPDSVKLKSAKLRFFVLGVDDSAPSYPHLELNVNFYKFIGAKDGSYEWGSTGTGDRAAARNFDSEYLGAKSMVWEEMPTGAWVEIPLNARGLEEVNKTGFTVMWARSVIEAIGGEPGWLSQGLSRIVVDTDYGGGNGPELVVEYYPVVTPRVVDEDENAAPGEGGDEVADILWLTPRCAFSDEKAGFLVEGEPGCPLELRLANDSLVIDALDDVVLDVNGEYRWYPELDGYVGKFRCEELTCEVNGTWGYSQAYISAGSCFTWAKYMEEPEDSWRRAEADYRVGSGAELLKWYWTSDMIAGDIPDLDVDIRQAGATQRVLYTSTMADLIADYYEIADADNEELVSSRYILGSFDEVADDLDGLIINFDNALIDANKGFYYLDISEDGVYKLEPQSAYLYMAPGNLSIQKTYAGGGSYNVTIENDDSLGLQDNLSQLKLEVLDDELVKRTVEDVLDDSDYLLNIVWLAEGNWSVKLYMSQPDEPFVYIRLWDGTQGPGGEEGGDGGGGWDPGGWWDWLTSGVGRWILLILCIGLEAVVFWRHKSVVTVIALCLVAAWIVMEWVDVWLVVLLALGAGLTVWALLRRKTQGGSE